VQRSRWPFIDSLAEERMSDRYMEAKKDLDQMKRHLRKLHMKKEQEISMRRVGRRLCATDIKEMREMEKTIEDLLDQPRSIFNSQQRSMFETVKNQYWASMRSWRNRLVFAEQYRMKRRRNRLQAAAQAKALSGPPA
jgi:hypothetical protein